MTSNVTITFTLVLVSWPHFAPHSPSDKQIACFSYLTLPLFCIILWKNMKSCPSGTQWIKRIKLFQSTGPIGINVKNIGVFFASYRFYSPVTIAVSVTQPLSTLIPDTLGCLRKGVFCVCECDCKNMHFVSIKTACYAHTFISHLLVEAVSREANTAFRLLTIWRFEILTSIISIYSLAWL